MGTLPDIRAKLRAAGLRATPAAVACLSALDAGRAMTVRRWAASRPGDTPSTAYRTLARLEAAGLAHAMRDGGETLFFACRGVHSNGGAWASTYCRSCGTVEEKPAPGVGHWEVPVDACGRCRRNDAV